MSSFYRDVLTTRDC